ncbi:MAG: GTP 3',8-cyclase MoaA [Eubacterium sp.]|nr:GTP 3',8-cyclase MoaA [Eubacterium sp.]
MRDKFDREINYLRISVTDECNLRCIYCMPNEGGCDTYSEDLLSRKEIVEIVQAAVSLGITKIRITGGEPLVRPDIVDICRDVASVKGIKELAITTNGLLLADLAEPLKEAGVTRVNVSLDTLQTDKFRRITRRGKYKEVVAGIRKALQAGLTPVKLNTVLIGGFNIDEIRDFAELTRKGDFEVRFIELMPIGECVKFPKSAFVKGDVVLEQVPELVEVGESGVARMFRFADGKGKVGIISPVSQHFCLTCNKIRLTCDGKIKPCLHSSEEILIKGLHGEELYHTMEEAIFWKPAKHVDLSYGYQSESKRAMNRIGG